MYSTRYSCQTLIKREIFFRQIFEKLSNIRFYENSSSGSRVIACGQTAMMKLIVHFRNLVKASKKFEQSRPSVIQIIQEGGAVRLTRESGSRRGNSMVQVSYKNSHSALNYNSLNQKYCIQQYIIVILIVQLGEV